jgi:mRNA interferase YafQ
MRTIEPSPGFKRDYKREERGQHRATLDETLVRVLEALVDDAPLEARHGDHELSGDWSGYRECHIKPGLLLIYRKPDQNTLGLARLGSHSELFGVSWA